MSRFQWSLQFVLFATLGFGLCSTTTHGASIPVILDTDIGSDIDDTWALAMLLGMPELDLKLIVTDYGNTPERTRLVAKILQRAGRTDIPIGTGIKTGDDPLPQKRWLGDFDLDAYPGKVHEDGVAALIDTIHAQPGIVTLITIGPVPNIKEALRRDPRIASKVRIVCTGGRIYKGFENGGKPPADWNVRADVASWQAMVAAPWTITTSPLDASAELALRGKLYATVADSQHPLARIVMENYKLWAYRDSRPKDASSALYDTAAVYLAHCEEYARIETLKLTVDDQGHTLISDDGKEVRCQLGWKDRKAFDTFLVKTLTASPRTTSPSPNDSAKPELVGEVLAGKRQEARASWWGFDSTDSTAHLQEAINSKVKRLILDRQASPWSTDGSDYIPHTPKNPDRPGWYFHNLSGVDTWEVNGREMLVWGNYCNVIGGATPVNIYYSNDNGQTVKIAYSFGQNSGNRDNGSGGGGQEGTPLGNPDNPIISRHVHCVTYNPAEDAFYACTGDFNTRPEGLECHWLRGTYDAKTDKWQWKVIVTDMSNSRWKCGGINFVDGKVYWISDSNGPKPYDRGVFCCDPADITNKEKHTRLFNPGVESGAMIIQEGVFLASHCAPASPMNTGIIISTDKGKTWAQYDLKEFGKRSPCRFNRMNSDGWFRMDLRSHWVTPCEMMFIKPKKA